MTGRQLTTALAVRQAVTAAGSHFFSKDTMRWFGSRMSEQVYPADGGTYFVTSERDKPVWISSGMVPGAWDGQRRYTVRFVAAGDITVAHPRHGKVTYSRGEFIDTSEDAFGKFGSRSGAHDAARRMASQGHPMKGEA